MSEQENMNQNEEEMEEEIMINQEDGEGQDMYAFEIEVNDEPYIIIIGKTDENKIFLRLMDKEDQSKPFFQNEFSLDDLRNINPIFNGIDREDLAFQYLASNLNDAEKDLKNIDEEKIIFGIIITDEDEKIEFEFPLYKAIDDGGENEMNENMENEMEEGEEEMIGINDLNELHQVNEVNEPNGESGHKEKNIPVQIEEKKEEIKESKKKEITPTNLIETKKEKEEKEKKEEMIIDNSSNQNMKEELLNIINSLNDNFNNQIMKQNEIFNNMKEDIIKQNEIKMNKMKEELNKKDKEITSLKNTIGNLEQKLNEYEGKLKEVNMNNENNKSLRNSKTDNINNKTVNELKANINEIKNFMLRLLHNIENFCVQFFSEKITIVTDKEKLHEDSVFVVKSFIHQLYNDLSSAFVNSEDLPKSIRALFKEFIREKAQLSPGFLSTFEFNRLEFDVRCRLNNMNKPRRALIIGFLLFYRTLICEIFKNYLTYFPKIREMGNPIKDVLNKKIRKINPNIVNGYSRRNIGSLHPELQNEVEKLNNKKTQNDKDIDVINKFNGPDADTQILYYKRRKMEIRNNLLFNFNFIIQILDHILRRAFKANPPVYNDFF